MHPSQALNVLPAQLLDAGKCARIDPHLFERLRASPVAERESSLGNVKRSVTTHSCRSTWSMRMRAPPVLTSMSDGFHRPGHVDERDAHRNVDVDAPMRALLLGGELRLARLRDRRAAPPLSSRRCCSSTMKRCSASRVSSSRFSNSTAYLNVRSAAEVTSPCGFSRAGEDAAGPRAGDRTPPPFAP